MQPIQIKMIIATQFHPEIFEATIILLPVPQLELNLIITRKSTFDK